MKALSLENTYTWVGYQKEVNRYLARADVFVLPSIWGEGMPTAVLEAMLMSKPVVATDNGGVNELIRDGFTGLCIPPGNAQALAEAIGKILESPEYARQLGISAREYVLRRHSLEKMVCDHLDVFSRLLDKQQVV
jgi:glycosyltransferase involved in cell wall biosynthesis